MQAQQETGILGVIRSNRYTRCQILQFLEAERRLGFNDVVEWVLAGEDDRLQEEDLGRVRRLVQVPRTNVTLSGIAPAELEAATPPDTLAVKAVFWSTSCPVAVIN